MVLAREKLKTFQVVLLYFKFHLANLLCSKGQLSAFLLKHINQLIFLLGFNK